MYNTHAPTRFEMISHPGRFYQTFAKDKICMWQIRQCLQQYLCGNSGLKIAWVELVSVTKQQYNTHYKKVEMY